MTPCGHKEALFASLIREDKQQTSQNSTAPSAGLVRARQAFRKDTHTVEGREQPQKRRGRKERKKGRVEEHTRRRTGRKKHYQAKQTNED